MVVKRYVLVVAVILSLLLLTGCWNRREVENLAIVTAMAFDQGADGKIHITVQIIKPGLLAKGAGGVGGGGGGVSQKPFWNLEGSGNTIIEAVRDLNLKSPRTLFFAHNQVLIFGDQLAREGLIPYLDRLGRSIEIRRTMNILVAVGKASDIVNAELAIERIPAVGISGLLQNGRLTSRTYAPNLRDFFLMLSMTAKNPVASKIEVIPAANIENKSAGQGEKQNPKSLFLRGLAVFKKDKLVGFLNPKETRGYLWTQSKVNRGIITILHEGQKVAFEVFSSTGEIKVKKQGDRFVANIKIKEDGDMAEHEGPVDVKPEEIKIYDRRQTAVIRNEIVLAVERAKDMKSDIFGFGEALHRSQPKEWARVEKVWNDEVFPNLDVKIDITANVRRRGIISAPPPFSE